MTTGYILTQAGGGLLTQAATLPPVTLTFRETLVAKLRSIAGVTAVVGQAIFPGSIPEPHDLGADGPALTYTIPTYPRPSILTGSDGTASARVRMTCWSYSQSAADAVALALFAALDGVPPVTGWADGSVPIMSVTHQDETEDQHPPRAGSDQWLYAITSEYLFRHWVPVPYR